MSRLSFALLTETFLTRAEDEHFIAKWRIPVFCLNCFGLIYLAILSPLSITVFGFPPSTLAVEFRVQGLELKG